MQWLAVLRTMELVDAEGWPGCVEDILDLGRGIA